MKNRFVTLLLVFTLLFSIFVPFVQSVDAEESNSITILPAVSTEEGIQLQWKTVTTASDEESFSVAKNNEELSVESIKQLSTVLNEQKEMERTYQLLDTDVVEDGEYIYTVEKTGETPIQTEPLTVTYQNNAQEIIVHIKDITETSMNVSWSEVQQAESYQLIVNGKSIDSFDKATSHELQGLTSGTSYSVNLRAIQKEKVVTEASQTVRTKEAVVKEEPKSTSNEIQTQGKLSSKQINIAATETVSIPDSALKRVIKRQLGIQSEEITVQDMEQLTELDASYENIKNLTGLEKAVNLTKLELAGNEIKNADPLKDLTKLEYLDISYYLGSKVEFLTKLLNLKTLILADTPVKDLNPISGLFKLETLDISFTGVTDLSPLAGLTSLKDINISYLELDTIMPLKDLSLATITMYGDRYFLLKEEVAAFEKANVDILHDDYFNVYISSIKANENKAVVKWEYEGEEEVDEYQIKVDGKVATVSADEHTYTVNDLTANTNYQVEILAFNSEGEQIGQATESFQTLSTAIGEKVVFNDPQLEKAIKNEFGLDRDIVESDMKHLKELSLERKRITDLTGLEKATNLEYLYLSANKITNIEQLASLKNLEYLYLDRNPISDFSPLRELTNIISLGLGDTGVKDLAFLANLQRLEDLSLENNQLESLATLPALNGLTYLSLNLNKLSSLEGIEKLNHLTTLYVDENPITSIEGLEQLQSLTDLSLSFTSLESIDRLVDMENLDYLSLYGIDLTGISGAMKVIETLQNRGVTVEYAGNEEEEWFDVYVGGVTEDSVKLYIDYYGEKEIATYEVYVNGKLKETLPGDESYLKLQKLKPNTEYEIEVHAYDAQKELLFSRTVTETTWDAPIGEVIPFKDQNLHELIKAELGLERDVQESDMEYLHSLYLYEEDIQDLTGLEYATNLSEFYVYGNSTALDLKPLVQLPSLYYLSIDDTPIKDYSVLKSMKKLQSLSIDNNQLKDLSFLQGMKNLTDITLQNNGIKDISALSSLTKLAIVNLANNQIKDLSPLLASKSNLFMLDLTGNPIEDLSLLTQFENLSDLILDETNVTDLSPLLELYNLMFLSLYGVPLDEEAQNVIEELKQYDVQVNLDVDNTPELYLDEVTETTISVSWDPMMPHDLPAENGVYKLNLYTNEGENLEQEIELFGAETNYQFTDLKPNTTYYVEVMVESAEYYGYLFGDVKTLPVEGSVKDVSLYVYDTEEEPAVDVMFDLYGIDPETEEQYFYGWSDEDGMLWDHTGEDAVDLFTLPVGMYEIVFTTADEEEIVFQFEIETDEEYIEKPIFFFLHAEDDEQTPPVVVPDGDKQQTGSKPNKVNKPSQPDTVNIEKTKKNTESKKNQLPETATMIYNLLLIGLIVVAFGSAILFIQKRKSA
ncbi:hypothetical protein CJ195_14230 [Bacillus sp. UMB0899]|nr:hypothetical protein CJ195_14230 [Bacillus sp. UMB0899]